MPDNQGLINVARGDAQATAAKASDWGPTANQSASIAQDQATSDRLSSPNHRSSVLHPAAASIHGPAVSTSPTDKP